MTKRVVRGFTLLEVMVAVTIIGVGITAVFAAQAGALASVHYARNVSEATGLARCKMSEVEELLSREGLKENDIAESGPCCAGEDDSLVTCTWRIERPELPEAKFGELNLDSGLDLAGGANPISGGSALGALGLLGGNQGLKVDQGGISDVAQSLAGDIGGATDTFTSMAMGIVYPDLQQLFQTGTRKVTVSANWSEGDKTRSVEIVLWVANGRAAGLVAALPGEGVDPEDLASGSETTSTGSGGTKTQNGANPAGGMGNLFSPKAPRK